MVYYFLLLQGTAGGGRTLGRGSKFRKAAAAEVDEDPAMVEESKAYEKQR